MNKYEFGSDRERLRMILENTVVDTALWLIAEVRYEKEKISKKLGEWDTGK